MKYDFWCFVSGFWERIDDEIDEQTIDVFFVFLDTILNVAIGRRDDFDAMIEREIISIQNIDFFDVARFWGDCFDVTDDVIESEISKIDSEWLTNDVSINVDSFAVNVAKNVDIAITDFDVSSASSFDVNSAKFAFDVKRDVIDADVAVDVISAISFADLIDFFWW